LHLDAVKEATFMSLLGNVRQTLGEAAATALDVGQNLSVQAQTQFNIKKLQIEHGKRLHELGVKTYEWYKTGSLVVTGQVPHEVRDLCHQLDGVQHQLEDEERKLEEMKQQAALRGAGGTPDAIGASQNSEAATMATAATNGTAEVWKSPTSHEINSAGVGITGSGSAASSHAASAPAASRGPGWTPPASTYAMTPGPDMPPTPMPPSPGPDMPRTPSEDPNSPLLPPAPPTGPGMPGVPVNPDLPPTMPPPGPPLGPMPGGPGVPTM
jgi:hypothetical protein